MSLCPCGGCFLGVGSEVWGVGNEVWGVGSEEWGEGYLL